MPYLDLTVERLYKSGSQWKRSNRYFKSSISDMNTVLLQAEQYMDRYESNPEAVLEQDDAETAPTSAAVAHQEAA